MLEEFILNQLSRVSVRKEELSEELNRLTAEEEKENDVIADILAKDDFNFDLFSPRTAGRGVKQEIAAVQKRIEAIRIQQTEVRERLEEVNENEQKYQKLLHEARTKSAEPNISDASLPADPMTGDEYHQITLKLVNDDAAFKSKDAYVKELETILNRVNNCFELSTTDRVRCRNELNNLRYYLKAQISDLQKH